MTGPLADSFAVHSTREVSYRVEFRMPKREEEDWTDWGVWTSTPWVPMEDGALSARVKQQASDLCDLARQDFPKAEFRVLICKREEVHEVVS